MYSIMPFFLRFCVITYCSLALVSCVFYPKQEDYFDPICNRESEKFVLAFNSNALYSHLDSCYDDECFDMLAAALRQITAEAVVITATVTVANTAYFLDRKTNCRSEEGSSGFQARYVIEEETVSPIAQERSDLILE